MYQLLFERLGQSDVQKTCVANVKQTAVWLAKSKCLTKNQGLEKEKPG